MPYGHLDADQCACVKRWVEGQVVLDLGAGDLTLAQQLLQLGATKVIAVDKDLWETRSPDPRIEIRRDYFHNLFNELLRDSELRGSIDIVFVSWPPNYQTAAEMVCSLFERVLYLGANTGGSACGGPQFWEVMSRREVLDYYPRRKNTICVYGPGMVEREKTGEELGAASTMIALKFEDAERQSRYVHGRLPLGAILRNCEG